MAIAVFPRRCFYNFLIKRFILAHTLVVLRNLENRLRFSPVTGVFTSFLIYAIRI